LPGTLAAHDIVKSHGPQEVIRGVSLSVKPGSRIGVVGPNGIGKSTLLRVLAGLEQPDRGSVTRSHASLRVGYLPQEPDLRPEETVLRYLARRTGVAAADADLEALAARLGDEPALADAYSAALERFLALGGGDFDARARSAAAEVGLAKRLDAPAAGLSGGEAARASLAAILLAQFDVFLLDEPTNDLDLEGLDVLERFVQRVPGGVVVVSHDRAFLDRTVTRILELEAETSRLREYVGGWSEYEAARTRARDREEAAYARYADERERFTSLLHARRTQARLHGVKAGRRGTHALASKVRSAERRLERLDEVAKPWQPWRLQLDVRRGPRGGDLVARLTGAVVRLPSFTLGPVDLELSAGDRIVVLGPNGSGKTTLLRALLGEVELAAGARRLGPAVVAGELEQRREEFELDEPLLDRVAARAGLAAGDARTLLAKFGLGAEDLARPARSLSPGERTRAALAALAARGVNLLVLDEPTNHLDLEAIEELEAALDGFPGTIVLVSHDRRLLERFQATRTLTVRDGRVRDCG
jgi:ATPase subunit of ABC transporter with duplicated ATPase domains